MDMKSFLKLKNIINNKSDKDHNHDMKYATKEELNAINTIKYEVVNDTQSSK